MGMVSLINLNCPHCLRDNAVLQVEGETIQPLKGTNALMAICRSCSGALIAEVEPGGLVSRAGGFHAIAMSTTRTDITLDCRLGHGNQWGVVKDYYPKAQTHSAPPSTPDRVSKFFVEAKDNFSRGNYETCGGLCRKVIDLATKSMAQAEDISAWKLQKRIEKLKEKGAITQEMYDWADIIRLDGNEQIHSEDEFDSQSAQAVLDFTETFLLYAFTLLRFRLWFRRKERWQKKKENNLNKIFAWR